jgi:hypothetical protein
MSDTIRSSDPRVSIINAVRTPLGFLVLGLLVVEGGLSAFAASNNGYPFLLLAVAIGVAVVYALLVAGLAAWRPEALAGNRPLQAVHANQLATDLYIALDGSLRNLERAERQEAWIVAADIITTSNITDSLYSDFCKIVAEKLKSLANVHNRAIAGASLIHAAGPRDQSQDEVRPVGNVDIRGSSSPN